MPLAQKERAAFIEENLGLVHACAGRFRGRGMEYDDLYAAGCVGLIKAYDGFDESRGLCFSTYAVPVILGEIKKLFRDGGAVKVSRSLKELGMKAGILRERFLKEYGREPSIGEMAQRLEVSKEQLAQAVNASLPTVSLTPVSDEEGGKEFDIPQESCEEHLTDLLSLKSVMSSLEKEERMLLYWRFFQNKTQSETAVKLGTTQVQVSRKERKLIEKMRRMMLEDV
ncbi:MAG TPA: sigma-70 family RNA polymerase sigma factor [Candidatus Ruthenibacterium merdavium]|uniref:Sigma-70 family RNA polymerase sigma factor n=1 Tax=Candidatus Ruthenibacterium merdavium TaxID=2838752 RepID=A0A9D2Q368_9FIRM|nr:sigma-70 family RNA polymerase sigma factor [Candidatus Ruthenibacterium merdavium]